MKDEILTVTVPVKPRAVIEILPPAPTGAIRNDVNGDGIADIVMINSQNMAGAWLMGADGSSKWLQLSGLPGTWDLFYVGNLNGDEYADVLLYDDTNKDIGAWYVDESGIPHWASLGRISADTTLIAANDFNGDELIDMVFRKADGTITVQINGGSSWSTALPKEWDVVATGDINGDGTADLVFRNGNAVGSWLVTEQGPSWLSISSIGNDSEIITAGDFNGDGTDDILICTNGSLGAWIMKDGKVSSWKALGNYSDTVKFESIGDYNGDGIDDIRVRDVNDLAAIYSYDDSYGWKKFGSVPSDWRTQLPAEEVEVETALRNDINGDGIADIAMIQSGTDAGAWLMDANGGSKWLGLSGLPGTWTLFDVRNVDGNKYADIILYDDTNKDVGLWLMDAKGVPTWQSGGKIAADATLLSAGDWNGDGIADLIYRKSDGTIGFKYLNGGANKEVGLSNDWAVVGTGDINGDGCDDIILRNGNSMGAWLMSASGPAWQSLSGVSSDNQVIGLGDFNGDGTDDVLFSTNGSLGAWLMKDGQVIGWRAFATFPASVVVESISDYNGDGTDDLRVRNGNDLAAVYSYTDGSVEWKKFGSVPSDWTTALAGKA